MSSIPPYLLASARSRALRASSAVHQPKPAQPTQAQSKAAQPAPAATSPAPQPKAAPAAAQPAAPAPKPAKRAKKGEGGNHSAGSDRAKLVVDLDTDDFEGLSDRVAAESADAEASALVRPHLPAVLRALVRGATVPGSAGVADRSLLLRLMRHSSSTAREQAAAARQLGNAVGDRLVAALARREQAAGRVIEGQSEPVGRASVAEAAPLERIA